MSGRADRIVAVMLGLSLVMLLSTAATLAFGGVEHAAYQAAIACYLLLLAVFVMAYSKKG